MWYPDICVGERFRCGVIGLLRLCDGVLVELGHEPVNWSSKGWRREDSDNSCVLGDHDVDLPRDDARLGTERMTSSREKNDIEAIL